MSERVETDHQDSQRNTVGCRLPRGSHFIVELNASWRIVDDPLQWILQQRKGSPRAKATGWANHSYCASKLGLTLRVMEHCGSIDPAALYTLEALPDSHPARREPE